jgi:hypothetical protein
MSMKRLLTVALLSLICFSAHAEWVSLNLDNPTSKTYVDLKSITQDKGFAKIWVLTDFWSTPENGREIVAVNSRIEFDCVKKLHRYVHESGYTKRMGVGVAAGASKTPNAAWEEILPYSPMVFVHTLACTSPKKK